MNTTYKTYKIKDICQVLNGRAYKQAELLQSGKYKVLRVGNFFTSKNWYYSNMELNDNKYCDNDDLLYAWSASFGPKLWDGDKTIYHYHIWKIVPHSLKVDKYYLYYWLLNNANQLTAGTHGSVMAHITKSSMENQSIDLPSLEIQYKVSDILHTIDEKIKKNEAINRNLSEQLQSIYLDRFSEDLNGELTDLCEYSKAKMDVVDLTRKSYFSTENMLPNKMGSTIASKLPSSKKTPKCKKGDVLISNIRPYFKKIVYCHTDAGHSTDVLCFTPKQREVSTYIYATLYTDKFFDYMVAGSKGTKMPRGDKQQIMKYPVHIPTKQELDEFRKIAENTLNMIRSNEDENDRLVGLRDTLLPKLMSGELDISALEI